MTASPTDDFDKASRAPAEDVRFETDELNTRVLWLYFMAGLTQKDVAHRLGLTRLRVNRIIGQARAEGRVHIEIRTPLARSIALAEDLKIRYGLEAVQIVPSLLDAPEQTQRLVGEAAGIMLEGMLEDGVSIGVGWGRTLSAAVRSMSSRRLRNAYVATLMGSLMRGSDSNTVGVATSVANRIGSECYYLAAPIYCPSVEIRSALLAHPGLEEVMRRASEVKIAIVSAGDMSSHSILASTQIVSPEITALKDRGGVGDILGVFLNEAGQPVDHPLTRRVMSLPLKAFLNIPVRLLASGGLHKFAIINAALLGGYVTHLVTDEAVADLLLQADHPPAAWTGA